MSVTCNRSVVFSRYSGVSSTNQDDRHDIAEIFWKRRFKHYKPNHLLITVSLSYLLVIRLGRYYLNCKFVRYWSLYVISMPKKYTNLINHIYIYIYIYIYTSVSVVVIDKCDYCSNIRVKYFLLIQIIGYNSHSYHKMCGLGWGELCPQTHLQLHVKQMRTLVSP